MKNVNEKSVNSEWLTGELKEEVKNAFEPRYGHMLTDDEVFDIAENLTGLMENILKFRFDTKYENQRHA